MRNRLMAASKAAVAGALSAVVVPVILYRHEVRRAAEDKPFIDWEDLARKIVDMPEWNHILHHMNEKYGRREDFDCPDGTTFH